MNAGDCCTPSELARRFSNRNAQSAMALTARGRLRRADRSLVRDPSSKDVQKQSDAELQKIIAEGKGTNANGVRPSDLVVKHRPSRRGAHSIYARAIRCGTSAVRSALWR